MARVRPIVTNLTGGELSPRLEGRVDLNKYPNGARQQENILSLPHGPGERRGGLRFVAEVKDSTKATMLMPFEFSTTQAYQIERGDGYFRFFKDKGQIVVANTDAAITNGTFASNISGWTDESTGGGTIAHDATNQRLSLAPGGAAATDIGWAEQSVTVTTMVEHVLRFRVIGAAGDKVKVRVGSSSNGAELLADKDCETGWHCVAFTPAASPFYVGFRAVGSDQNKTVQIDDVSLIDNAPLEIASPYSAARLSRMKWAQSADVLYLAHPQVAQYKLSRTGHTSWSLTIMNMIDGPYLDENGTPTTLTPGAATGFGVTLTASAVTGINNNRGFLATDVGRSIRLKEGSVWGWARIVGYTSTTVVTIDIKTTLTNINAKSAWRLGLWSDTSGYPSCVTFHEERLMWGGAEIERPQRLDGSATADFETFTPGTADADAIAYNIGSNKVSNIRWMVSERVLLVGTVSTEFRVGEVSQTSPLTPSNVSVKPLTRHGSADLMPIEVSNATLLVQRQGRKLRELVYRFDNDGYVAPDLTLLAEHITIGGIVDVAYQQEPYSLVWAARADGMLLCCTYVRDQDVVAWHRHPLGGDARAEAVSSIPGTAGSDELWVVAKIAIGGVDQRYVCVLEDPLPLDGDQEDAFYVDFGLTYDGAAADVISGLDHLEGEEVQILADGAVHPVRTVTGGQITLQADAQVVQVGLQYVSNYQPQRLEAGAQAGTAQGEVKRISAMTVRVYRSLGVQIGRDEDSLEDVEFRDVGDLMDAAIPLYSGDKTITFPGEFETAGDILVRQDQPLPLTIVALMPTLATMEG